MQLFNHLLNLYSKSLDFINAQKLFDEMPERNLVSFSALISGYSQSAAPHLAFDIVPQLQKQDLSPNEFVFSSLILACSKLKSVDYGKQIHAQVITSDFQSDLFVKTSLIDMYSKFGDLESAFWIFSQCPFGDLVMYNSMISGLVNFGSYKEAFGLFMELLCHFDLKPTEFTLCSVIKACVNLEIEMGEQIHCFSVKVGLDMDCFVGTALVDMYGRFSDMGSSEMVFESILWVDLALYNAMIVGFSQNSLDEFALEFFKELKLEGFRPNECTFSSVLKACSGIKCLNLGRILHGVVEKSEFKGDLVVTTALIDMYMKCGCVQVSCRLFDSILERNTILYNSMIHGHGKNGNFDEAMRLFMDMNRRGYEVNLATFIVAVSSCLGYERIVYVQAIKRGFGLDPMVQNALLDGLIKGGAVMEARWFFDKMHERSVVSWTTIISGFCQLGLDLDALEFFKMMCSERVHPNCFTFSCILKACGSLAGLEQGRCIHGCCIKHGIFDEEFTKSSLLDMYAKCGALEESYRLFDEFHNRDIVSWNTIIVGCARHGYGGEALKLLERMEECGVKPNHVTYISLLWACSHCGLVDDGVRIFESMTHKHGIIPSMEHYACMVDMFGRAGTLDRAKCLIDRMPFEPDLLIWKTFLAFCKLPGDAQLAQLASDHVFRMEGQDNATCVLMSNIYSELGMWDDVEKVRNKMRDEGKRKEPGVSWVQIKDTSWASSTYE
ncbi:pentatricopeptide repeat-containing protein At4g39530-like [Magnolia sinica]|uniref:pentatricopeptide repeat-containing protein At4g39530-like n=1 Tax=Magnolia sinica TaxID=86752 RepID=UPI00265984E9|nr:pentatricopeptide repeat-containing protein At4g39530-like [Magnolia sinica]